MARIGEWFKEERRVRDRWKEFDEGDGHYKYTQRSRFNSLGRSLAVGALALGALYLAFADSKMDMLGDRNAPALSADKAKAEAVARYQRTFEAAPPTGKFALQYLTPTDAVVRLRKGGNGPLGLATEGDKAQFTFNNGCLNKTAYDINGGDIEGMISGVFTSGYISGEVPTAAANAYVDSDNPNTLVITSGHANSRDLRFSGLTEGSELEPLDQLTEDVLKTYGCSTGLQGEPTVGNLGTDSSWLKQ